MRKKVLILEDNGNTRKAVSVLVESIEESIEVFAASDIGAAYAETIQTTIDVFIIDIILNPAKPGDVSGIVFAQKIRSMDKYAFTPIIFITSLQDLELYSYKNLHCFGYIEKPFDVRKVHELVKQAVQYETRRDDEKTIYFRRDGILYAYEIQKIIYAEVCHHILHIYAENQSMEIPYKTCKDFLRDVDSKNFLQCSRSTVVNRKKILNIDFTNKLIQLKGCKKRIEIGVTFIKKMGWDIKL